MVKKAMLYLIGSCFFQQLSLGGFEIYLERPFRKTERRTSWTFIVDFKIKLNIIGISWKIFFINLSINFELYFSKPSLSSKNI